MSGRHPWNELFEGTFSPKQRARIIRDADKLVADNRRPRPPLRHDDSQDAQNPPQPRATTSVRRAGRTGKSNVTGYFDPEVKRQLRIMAAEHDTTIQDLLGEALNELFAKHGKPEIAPQRAP